MSSNPFRDFAEFAASICQEELQRSRPPNRLPRPLMEAQQHIAERQATLRQHRSAALAAYHQTGHDALEVERRVVVLYDACIKLLLWERDAPRHTEEERRQQELVGGTGCPSGAYLIGLVNQFWPLWEPVNDLASVFDGYTRNTETGTDRLNATAAPAAPPAPADRDQGGAERGEGGKPPTDPYADLRQFARGNLKGQERAVIEAVCDAGGELSLADVKTLCDWQNPIDSAWNSLRARLNKKLKSRGWKLRTNDRAARLTISSTE